MEGDDRRSFRLIQAGPQSLLADTWWFGTTARLSAERFEDLARQRATEGFTAVQIVVGIPPEVGPEHPAAASAVGPAWSADGRPNDDYLELARDRLRVLLDHGLTPIVYGAWGHQLDWLGPERMVAWWRRIVGAVDALPVVYCLTGESSLWLQRPDRLLPGLSTGELHLTPTLAPLAPLRGRVGGVLARWARRRAPATRARRARGWTTVLVELAGLTRRPILVHTVPGERGRSAVGRPSLLAAESVQTGHRRAAASELWREPLRAATAGLPFLNLEPWYEGILGDFGTDDQLHAYWASVACGASGHAYGAHGVWNVGDGRFLAHWGSQTLDEGSALPTPALLGAGHQLFREVSLPGPASVSVIADGPHLRQATRSAPEGASFTYIPDVAASSVPRAERYFLPATGEVVAEPPRTGSVVAVAP